LVGVAPFTCIMCCGSDRTLDVKMAAETNLSITSIAGLTNNPNQTITGTGAVGATVKVLDGTTLLGTTVVGLDGTWSEVVALSGDGVHSISAQSAEPMLTTLVNLATNSVYPHLGLVISETGKLYGTTSAGGSNGRETVFELSGTDHRTLTTLVEFDGSNGRNPNSVLVSDSAGNLYGTTSAGGSGNAGTVYKLSGTNHQIFTTLVNFDGTNGARPIEGLLIDSAGNLYGATYEGGANNLGTVYTLTGTDNNTLTTLVNFNGTNGRNPYPYSGLTTDEVGNIYGTTLFGGSNDLGTVYKLYGTNYHILKTLVDFDGNNGALPVGGLLIDASSNLIGTTQRGGSNSLSVNDGTFFYLSGTEYETLRPITTSTPKGNYRGLVIGGADSLYGTAIGEVVPGGIVKLSGTNYQTITTLVTFDGTNGSSPYGTLLVDTNGTVYGSAYSPGPLYSTASRSSGVIFEFGPARSNDLTYLLDTIAPKIIPLSQVSNNVNNNLAKLGDVITESFTSTDTVTSVLINGQAASVVHGVGDSYTATYVVQANSINGLSNASITAQDLAGNITTNSYAGSVVVDTVAPLLTIDPDSSRFSFVNSLQNIRTISGTGEAGSTVEFTDLRRQVSLGSTTVASDGTWNETLVFTDRGSYPVHAVVTDVAGNSSRQFAMYSSVNSIGPDLIGNATKLVISEDQQVTNELLTAVGSIAIRSGGDGIASFDRSFPYRALIAVQSDGRLLIMEGSYGSLDGIHVAPSGSVFRLNVDGGLDESFSSFTPPSGSLFVLSDDKIVVYSPDRIISKFNQDGTKDITFGLNGSEKYDFSYGRGAIAEQADGKILILNSNELIRINNDGSVDLTFASGGRAASVVGNDTTLKISGDGEVIAAGDLGIARYTNDGELDSTFAVDGFLSDVRMWARGEIGRAIGVDSNGRVLAATADGLERFTAKGVIDTSFAEQGVLTQTSPVTGISIQLDGKILINSIDGVDRLTSSGQLDATFVKTNFRNSGMLSDDADNIIVAGTWFVPTTSTMNEIHVSRFTPDGLPDPTFSLPAVSTASFNTSVISASNNLGNLVLASDGSYTYSVANSAVQYLNTHQTKVDTFTITSSDGTTKDVSFTINGVDEVALVDPSNHAPTVSAPLTSTSAVRTQAFWSNLLAGASDADAGDHLSVTGLTYTVNGGASSAQAPSGIQLINNQLLVDPSNTAFSNLTTGQSETIVASYTIADDHGGSVAQTNTIVIGSPAIDPIVLSNHAPTVVAPLATTFSKGSQAFWSNLLSGATDVDARNTLNVTDLRFSVAGAATTTVAPTGLQFANNQLLVDPNSTAFKDLTLGQTETIVASYNISDGYGGAVAQTNSLTVTGLGATSAGSNPNSSPSLISVAAALQSTSTAGTQGFWSNLLAGATNTNPNAHLDVANLRFSVNSGASTVIAPVGIQYANKSIMVDPNNTAFRALAAGQSETIVASYNIVDGLGSSVAQTDTIIINGQGSQGASSGGVNTPTPNNHAPEVSAPVTAQAGVHTSAFWSNMLAGATDSDVGNQLHVSNVLFSLNGGVAVASAPTGIQVVNDQLLVDPNSTAFNHLGVGQADTIVASYNVIDGHGGSVAQTDTVTISGPVATVANGTITGTANHDILLGTSGNDTFLIGTGADTITGGRGADVFKYTSLSNSPTSSTAPTTTITDFSSTDGDRVDVSAILNGTSTLNSTIHVNQTGTSNTSLSVTVGGVEYYIANVPNQAVSVPDAVANPASGATLTTALHGADWTTVVDVASAHGAPSTITAAGTGTVTNAAANPNGDWTAIVQAGAATVDTAQSQVTFAAAPTANAVSVQTADTTVHEVSNVTAVVWHL
jgi:uncharacterized delta-60 repeat protein